MDDADIEDLLDSLSPEELAALRAATPAVERRAALVRSQNLLGDFRPYKRQLEFFAGGKDHKLRAMLAGNQLGKTLAAGIELACHMTGLYPIWWPGVRFDKPIRAMAGSESGELTKKGIQRVMLGASEFKDDYGTGTIPRSMLLSTSVRLGVANAVSSITTRHVSGSTSTLLLLSYESGRRKWQAETLDFVWLDEEPPEDVFVEAVARTAATGGQVICTFTPLLGMSTVVTRFMKKSPSTILTRMTVDDVDHITPERREELMALYPTHMVQARLYGVPMLGSGRVFAMGREEISVKPIKVPDYWPRIVGLDLGYEHPQAAVELVRNPDSGILYVTHAHRASHMTPSEFVPNIMHWAYSSPVAWPHDGMSHDRSSGHPLKELYKQAGLNMLPKHATFQDGSTGVEAAYLEMLQLMRDGRFKVFDIPETNEWFEEFELLHRLDGKIVAETDDLLAATRYALMCMRFMEPRSKGVPVRTGRQLSAPGGTGNSWMAN